MYPKCIQVLMLDSWFLYLIILVFVTIGLCIFVSFKRENSKWLFQRLLKNDDNIRFCFKTIFFNLTSDLDLIFHIY